MRLKTILCCAIICAAHQLTLGQEIFAGRGDPTKFINGKLASLQNISERSINGYPIINLGQDYQFGFSKVRSASTNSLMGEVLLYAVTNQKNLLSLRMIANISYGGNSNDWWSEEPCKRDNFLWKNATDKSFHDVNCVSINHTVGYMVNPGGEFDELLAQMKAQDIQFAPTVLRATFTRYTRGGRYLSYVVDLNPEHFGVERDDTVPWAANSWHKDRIHSDPKKVAVLDGIKRWATDVQKRMDAAFNKEADAFKNLKSIRAYLNESTGTEKHTIN